MHGLEYLGLCMDTFFSRCAHARESARRIASKAQTQSAHTHICIFTDLKSGECEPAPSSPCTFNLLCDSYCS